MKIGISIGIILGLVAAISYSYMSQYTVAVNAASLQEAAETIVGLCAESNHRPTCYDEEIPRLMEAGMSMEDAFVVTREVQLLDQEYQYCHVLGHYLAAHETAKDPERWKEVVARAPIGVCSNGAIHGAFQERFRVASMEDVSLDDIAPELQGICTPRENWQPTQMGVATCTHALGHLTMYVTAGDIDQALLLCDRLVPTNHQDSSRQLCYDGAFMQIFQPLDPEDFALIAGREVETKEASVTFCNQYSGPQRGSCLSERWPLFRDEMNDPETVAVICELSRESDWQYERCLSGVFYVTMAMSNLDVAWAESFCSALVPELQGICFGNSATRLIETDDRNVDKALAVCRASEAVGAEQVCYDELVKYSSYIFKLTSTEFSALCAGMPEPWQQTCFRPLQ